MGHINSPAQIKAIMQANGLTFHKGLGQNFLFDDFFLSQIVDSGDITKDDVVLEIGPGLGVLTTRLAEKAKKVIAVEIDQNIVPVLQKLTVAYNNIEIINRDILKTDLSEILPADEKVKVVANLPYYITSPIIMKLLTEGKFINTIVIMIQKEVADRIVALPSTKDYGALTVAVQYYSNPKKMVTVPAGAFIPPPKVDSTVLRLDIPETPKFSPKCEKTFFRVVKGAFGQRRKTLVNALSSAFSEFAKDDIKDAIVNCNLQENVRGETLDIQKFVEISNFLINKKRK